MYVPCLVINTYAEIALIRFSLHIHADWMVAAIYFNDFKPQNMQ